MTAHGGIHGGDRRPWLIISKREAQAIMVLLEDAVREMDRFPLSEVPDLRRAARVIQKQLDYIEGGQGIEPDVGRAIIRDMHA